MNNYYVITDIETKPNEALKDLFMDGIKAPGNLKDPEKIASAIEEKRQEAIKDMSIDEDFSEVFCVGIKVCGQEPIVMTMEEYVVWLHQECEVEMVKGAKSIVKNYHRTMVTFNGKEFDVPILMKTALRKGLDFPYREFLNGLDKFKGTDHIDLMQKVNFRWGKQKSLDKYLQIYLGIKKKEIDFATCSDEELREHCREDLVNTEKLYLLFKDII